MQLQLGVHVYSCDGHDVGTIRYLILDPATAQVKTVVIEKGFLLHHDVEVPLEAFRLDGSERQDLTYTAEEVNALPHFDKSRYTEPPSVYARPYLGLPIGALLWPASYSTTVSTPGLSPAALPVLADDRSSLSSTEQEEIAQIERQVERSNAVIDAGSDVISQDGEKVGEIHNVNVDTTTGKPTSIVIRRGYGDIVRQELPAEAIASVDDNAVYLNLTAEQVKALPHTPGDPVF